MSEKEIEDFIEKHEYVKMMTKDTIFTTIEDFKMIDNSAKIIIDGMEISIEFLKRILDNEKYYNYAEKYFKNEIKRFRIQYIYNGDINSNISYNKTLIIKGIEMLINNHQLVLSDLQIKKYTYLKDLISYDRFLNESRDKNYDIIIDKVKYSIPIDEIISFMEMNDKEFDNLFENTDILTVNNIPKLHFLYASYMYFSKNHIIDNYLVSDIILKRFKELKSMQKVDFEAVNQIISTVDTKFMEVTINNELIKIIKNGLPKNISPIEKAIYIYIKMCKILTYDDEYYAVNQRGSVARKHQDINYIEKITPENNKIVCFEFNLIFSMFLYELGINFQNNYSGMIEESYGLGHVNLEFRYEKFLIAADSVTTILKGDLMQAKLNQPLVGLQCLNRNEQTKEEFSRMVSKIYQLIIEQERDFSKNQKVEHIEDFEEIVSAYTKVTDNLKQIDLKERLSILIEKVNSTKMVGVDSLSYVLQLQKILFTHQERVQNVAVTVIRNNNPIDRSKLAEAIAIFTINIYGFENNIQQNYYYCFYPNQELVPILRNQLQRKFEFGEFDYIQRNDPIIPGINEVGDMKR